MISSDCSSKLKQRGYRGKHSFNRSFTSISPESLLNDRRSGIFRVACLVMEAMKMEHTLVAPYAGVVGAVPFAAGQLVSGGATLIELAAEEAA